jgi:hypothetical protein
MSQDPLSNRACGFPAHGLPAISRETALCSPRDSEPCRASVGAILEIRLKDRLQHELGCCLHHTVAHRRYAQGPLPSIGLRDVPPQESLRSIPACAQLGANPFQEPLDAVLLDRVEGLTINPRRAAVGPRSPPRLPQDVTPVDTVIQRVKAPPGCSLGRTPQSALQVSHVIDGQSPVGVVGRRRSPRHALARSRFSDTITAGALPSGCLVRDSHHRYYDPLGLPLRSARLRLRLIRATLPRHGPRRRASPVPLRTFGTCRSPYPGGIRRPFRVWGCGRGLHREMIGSASTL